MKKLAGIIGVAIFLLVLDGSHGILRANRYGLNGAWQRVSPPVDMDTIGSDIRSQTQQDMLCAANAPRHIYFFDDEKYASSGTVFAGGDYLVLENKSLRLQTINGLSVVRYAKTERQLILDFGDFLDGCMAVYER